jgi:hypothetical protein
MVAKLPQQHCASLVNQLPATAESCLVTMTCQLCLQQCLTSGSHSSHLPDKRHKPVVSCRHVCCHQTILLSGPNCGSHRKQHRYHCWVVASTSISPGHNAAQGPKGCAAAGWGRVTHGQNAAGRWLDGASCTALQAPGSPAYGACQSSGSGPFGCHELFIRPAQQQRQRSTACLL